MFQWKIFQQSLLTELLILPYIVQLNSEKSVKGTVSTCRVLLHETLATPHDFLPECYTAF